MNWKFFVPVSIVHLLISMVLMKVFTDSPVQLQATGGVLVSTGARMLILFVTSAATFIIALSIVTQRTRVNRQAEEQMLEKRRTENMATVGA